MTKKKTRTRNKSPKLRFDILTIFPEAFNSYFEESLIKRARQSGLIEIKTHNLRDWSEDRHKKVDDRPFGGGPGMVLKVEPIYKAVKEISRSSKPYVILFSTRGKKFNAEDARRLSKKKNILLICGRYEGVDERVAEHVADEEISMGDYVLSGGELPAMILTEAVSRFIPGFLGKIESLEDVRGSFPAYTRPEEFKPQKGQKAWVVPKVLLGGDHAKIEAWRRRKQSAGR